MNFDQRDSKRRLHNTILIATVKEIDWNKRQFRAQRGNIITGWLPFPADFSNNYRRWIPLRKDSQIVLVAASGDINTASAVGMLWSDSVPALDMPLPDRPTRDRIEFDDGTVIEYDSQRKKLNLHTPGDIHIHADGQIRMDAAMIYLNCGAEETWNYE